MCNMHNRGLPEAGRQGMHERGITGRDQPPVFIRPSRGRVDMACREAGDIRFCKLAVQSRGAAAIFCRWVNARARIVGGDDPAVGYIGDTRAPVDDRGRGRFTDVQIDHPAHRHAIDRCRECLCQ